MEESTKHGPRIANQMAHEQQGDRVEERFRDQGPTEDEDLPTESRPDLDDVVDLSGVEERSDIARWLEPSRFPAGKDEVIEMALEQRAPDHVLDDLRSLPDDGATYGNVQDVWEALGGTVEQRF